MNKIVNVNIINRGQLSHDLKLDRKIVSLRNISFQFNLNPNASVPSLEYIADSSNVKESCSNVCITVS